MTYTKKTGIFIPKKIMEMNKLTLEEKILLAVIWYLIEHGKFDYAWPDDEYLSAVTTIDYEKITEILKSLEKKEKIKSSLKIINDESAKRCINVIEW